MHESIAFLVRVQYRRKESSRSLSHLLMSFLYFMDVAFRYVMFILFLFYYSFSFPVIFQYGVNILQVKRFGHRHVIFGVKG